MKIGIITFITVTIGLLIIGLTGWIVSLNPKPQPQPLSSAVKFDGGLNISMLKLLGFSNVVIFVQRDGMVGRVVLIDETNGVLTAPVGYPK